MFVEIGKIGRISADMFAIDFDRKGWLAGEIRDLLGFQKLLQISIPVHLALAVEGVAIESALLNWRNSKAALFLWLCVDRVK